ncbi:DEAH box polypeptide 37 [Pelomyxa schiedti]|nr:DEAH box polypeptide 37 [Pelomyxa schiedti]
MPLARPPRKKPRIADANDVVTRSKQKRSNNRNRVPDNVSLATAGEDPADDKKAANKKTRAQREDTLHMRKHKERKEQPRSKPVEYVPPAPPTTKYALAAATGDYSSIFGSLACSLSEEARASLGIGGIADGIHEKPVVKKTKSARQHENQRRRRKEQMQQACFTNSVPYGGALCIKDDAATATAAEEATNKPAATGSVPSELGKKRKRTPEKRKKEKLKKQLKRAKERETKLLGEANVVKAETAEDGADGFSKYFAALSENSTGMPSPNNVVLDAGNDDTCDKSIQHLGGCSDDDDDSDTDANRLVIFPKDKSSTRGQQAQISEHSHKMIRGLARERKGPQCISRSEDEKASSAKRLSKFKEKMKKFSERKAVMESLIATAIPKEQVHLYHSSATLGQKETTKQHSRRLFNEMKAGISITTPRFNILEEVKVEPSATWEPDQPTALPPPLTPEEEQRVQEMKEKKKHKKLKEKPAKASAVKNSLFAFTHNEHASMDDNRDEAWFAEQSKKLCLKEPVNTEDNDVLPTEVEKVNTEALPTKVESVPAAEPIFSPEPPSEEETTSPLTCVKEKDGLPTVPCEIKVPVQESTQSHTATTQTSPAAVASFGWGPLRKDDGKTLSVQIEECADKRTSEEAEPPLPECSVDVSEDLSVNILPSENFLFPLLKSKKYECRLSAKEIKQRKLRSVQRGAKLVFVQEMKPLTYNMFRVEVQRPEEIQTARLALPIHAEESAVMEAIQENPVSIICGETGSGKTTQVPQFLYEAGFGNKQSKNPGIIGVTQPRRVAAISMAYRVAYELNFPIGQEVAYQIRFDSLVQPTTQIKFMTDGILMREIQTDFLLTKYSVIILDEAHERNINTDILIGLLSRIVPLRNKLAAERKAAVDGGEPVLPLKLVVMSATLRVEDFTANQKLFPVPPPVVKIPSRQYPVTVHYNKRTPTDYVMEAFSKVCKIHTKLPSGGILVFLTGQQEIEQLCRKLKERFPSRQSSAARHEPLQVLPMFAALSPEKQQRVFQNPKPGSRLCVVATNVAETAITIPGVSYVVDCGKAKQRVYDKVTGTSAFIIDWISKASADQRAGRAGRTSAGHCYRLYSSAVFTDTFEQHTPPEILRIPIENVVLQMKAMNLDNVTAFPFPTPPQRDSLETANKVLINLGAIDPKTEKITKIGESMAHIPVHPRFAKMLLLSKETECFSWMASIVAAFSVHSLFSLLLGRDSDLEAQDQGEDQAAAAQSNKSDDSTTIRPVIPARVRNKEMYNTVWANKDSDLLASLKAVESCRLAISKGSSTREFCEKYHLHQQSMSEILDLREQLLRVIDLTDPTEITLPNTRQELLIRQLIASGFVDQVARLMSPDEAQERQKGPSYPFRTFSTPGMVFVHPSSFLYLEPPDFIVYHEIIVGKYAYMRGITRIHPLWLPSLAPHLIARTETLDNPPPFYDPKSGEVHCHVRAYYGPDAWPLPADSQACPNRIEKYRYFVQALLQGKVLPLGKAQRYLTSGVNTITRFNQPRITGLVQPLISLEVDSKEKILAKWKEDSQFLLPQILPFVEADDLDRFKDAWLDAITTASSQIEQESPEQH